MLGGHNYGYWKVVKTLNISGNIFMSRVMTYFLAQDQVVKMADAGKKSPILMSGNESY